MINISDKSKCCGCSACLHICAKHCITMVIDNEGFLYPKVDTTACIDCGMCEKVCPALNQTDFQDPLSIYAVINSDDDIREQSSSGGLFPLIAEKIIEKGGVVFGARFDESWLVVIDSAETKAELSAFRGSKYLQARIEDSYRKCKEYLLEGRYVLFSGTPCQIAGLKNYLHKPYSKLLTVDFICHGVPSPEVWRKYLCEIKEVGTNAICDWNFRENNLDWKESSFVINYEKGGKNVELISSSEKNPFMRLFLNNIILRPSCYSCPAKEGKSQSDITIADFWGIDKVDSSMFDNYGTSMVIFHNSKIQPSILLDRTKYVKVPLDSLRFNSSYSQSSPINPARSLFFNGIDQDSSFLRYLSKFEVKRTFTLKSISFEARVFLHRFFDYIMLKRKVSKKTSFYLRNKGSLPEITNVVLDGISFRDKRCGWKNSSIRLVFKIVQ